MKDVTDDVKALLEEIEYCLGCTYYCMYMYFRVKRWPCTIYMYILRTHKDCGDAVVRVISWAGMW